MPEPNVLYGVTLLVVLGLLAWVAYVLKTAKEPWARPLAPVAVAGEDAPLVTDEPAAEAPGEAEAKEEAEEPAKAEKAD